MAHKFPWGNSEKSSNYDNDKDKCEVGETKVIDTNLIYNSIIGLQASAHEIHINDVLSRELSPIPTAKFT